MTHVRLDNDANVRGPIFPLAYLTEGMTESMAHAVEVGFRLNIGYCADRHPALSRPPPL